MAIYFNTGSISGTEVNFGTPTHLNNILAGAGAAWIRIITKDVTWANYFIYKPGTNITELSLLSSSELLWRVRGTGSNLDLRVNLNNQDMFSTGYLGKWIFVAWAWRFAGTTAEQIMYLGTLSRGPSEVEIYVNRLSGSGGHDDSTADFRLGNAVASAYSDHQIGMLRLFNQWKHPNEFASALWKDGRKKITDEVFHVPLGFHRDVSGVRETARWIVGTPSGNDLVNINPPVLDTRYLSGRPSLFPRSTTKRRLKYKGHR